jgi:hypothetical protein
MRASCLRSQGTSGVLRKWATTAFDDGVKERTMKSLRMLVLLSAAVVTAGGAQTARAGVQHDSCLSVNASAIGQNLGGGRTEATIFHAGILNGTTSAQLEITGGTPPVLTFVGTGVLTTHHGTLTVSTVGTFNGATGAFEATGQVVHGTGVFAGATGALTFVGVEDLTSGRFTQTVTGTVCLAHG